MSAEGMPKAYEPAGIENKWYQYWETNGLFHGNNLLFQKNSYGYTISKNEEKGKEKVILCLCKG